MEQQITILGQRINYVKVGTGKHCILCLPGALGTIWTDFKPQIEGFDTNKFTIVVWDPPGYGRSRPPNKNFTPDFLEDDADMAYEFMKVLGIDKWSLLGWSDGGISSIILAAKHSDCVNKLVIWGSRACVKLADVEEYEKGKDLSTWSERMLTPLLKVYGKQGLTDTWMGLCCAIRKICEEREGSTCKDKLGLIRCPTLIMHGDKDSTLSPEQPVYLLENIKDSRLHRFTEGKHNLQLRYSAEFNKLVTKFLEEN